MLQPVFCNALYSVLRRFVQWRFARPRYFCKVLMKNRENMEERFDFADFYESHYRSALRYASMYVFNDEDARDIVSDVLLRFLEQGEKLNRERNVVGLFFSMIYNKCMDYLRRRSRFKQIKYKLKQTADRFSDDEFEALCHKELFRIIGETLSEMPALQQECFWISTWKGRLISKWQKPGISLNAWWNISCVRPKGLSVAVYNGCTVRMDFLIGFFIY